MKNRAYGGGGGGGGGGLCRPERRSVWLIITSQEDRGVPLGGPEPDPVILRSAHEKSTLSYSTLLKTFKCIPCCNIGNLLHTSDIPCQCQSDWGR